MTTDSSSHSLDEILRTAVGAARKSSDYLMQSYGTPEKAKVKRSRYSIVCDADLHSQAIIVGEVKTKFPEHEVVAEESEHNRINSHYVWVIDPIDGSSYYIKGIPTFSISIAFLHDYKVLVGVVLCPAEDELFYAIKGQGAFLNRNKIAVSEEWNLEDSIVCFGHRILRLNTYERAVKRLLASTRSIRAGGSCAQELCYVACGRTEGLISLDQSVWDYAAGKLIVEEAGGIFSGFSNEQVDFSLVNERDFSIVASNGKVQETVINILSDYENNNPNEH